jgi:arginine/lysine/ornithine decarboxylase
MPGHKRNSRLHGTGLPYDIDLTEIYGFDNLQNPEGILRQTEELASELYGSKRAFLSVNGSTGAILAAIYACVKPNDKVIMARNCHKAVYNAIEINRLQPVYINPEAECT